MIEFISGNIFDSTADCIVNPVNCVGVMGAGLALEFRRRFPSMYITYQRMCGTKELAIGKIAFYAEKQTPARSICLFPTKRHWRELSTMDAIERGLAAFIRYAPDMNIKSATFPMLGCGLGGLNWEFQVQPLMEHYFTDTPFEIQVITSVT